MKIRLLLALAGLAIGFTTPTFAQQQKETVDLGMAQQRDIIGDAKALGEFGEFTQKRDEALSNRDAAALAALFTEDALLVAPDGIFSDRPENGRVLFKARLTSSSSGATGQRFMFVRATLGRFAC